ncbi:MAG: NUDIX domain-containing protein [Longimicrobiales bacterium]|nr:NUDIX domain-containing protein [Longimicrobiales bacterium]
MKASRRSAGRPRDVVACVVRDTRGHLLVGRRPSHKRHGDLWEFPGGKVRDDETLGEAAKRELAEELGVRVIETDADPTFVALDEEGDFRIVFLRVRIEGTPRLLEHVELRWIDPLAPLELRFAPADLAYVTTISAGL